MGKYFGTDGIRGKADELFTESFCVGIGVALGRLGKEKKKRNIKVLIGRDTRISGEGIQEFLVNGLLQSGSFIYDIGVTTTPSLAFLVKKMKADYAVVISASHNPYDDNGIKIFNSKGFKITHSLELNIEEFIEKEEFRFVKDLKNDNYVKFNNDLYIDYIVTLFKGDYSNCRILLDCANGATSIIAPQIFNQLQVRFDVINDKPNGYNINKDCGSTHIEKLKDEIVGNGYDIAFSFDGDGDRVLALDHQGNVINGDHILYMIGHYLKENKSLKSNKIVLTPMTNFGIAKAIEKDNIKIEYVDVGDKYVLDAIEKEDLSLGGEQSGHIIIRKYATTGDGILTALYVLKILREMNCGITNILPIYSDFPQKLINVKVKNKTRFLKNEMFLNIIELCNNIIGEDGRIFVRASGTEPLVRILIETKQQSMLDDIYYKIMDVVNRIV